MVLDYTQFASAALFLTILRFLLKPDSVGNLLDLQSQALAHRLRLHVAWLTQELCLERSLVVKELEFCLLIILDSRVLFVILVFLELFLPLPLVTLLWIYNSHADQV